MRPIQLLGHPPPLELSSTTSPLPVRVNDISRIVSYLGCVGDAVYYKLQLLNGFDTFYANGYTRNHSASGYCGSPGQLAGMTVSFMASALRAIPYNQYVEVPFTVRATGLCNTFNDIAIQLVASCEDQTTTSSKVSQYGIYPNTRIDYNTIVGPAMSIAMFSVAWPEPPLSTRRLEESIGMTESKVDLNSIELTELRAEFKFFTNFIMTAAIVAGVTGVASFGFIVWMFAKLGKVKIISLGTNDMNGA